MNEQIIFKLSGLTFVLNFVALQIFYDNRPVGM